jgi:glycosyltransferase involved in cell wall biosynthesis
MKMRIGFVSTDTIQRNSSTIRCLELGKQLVHKGHEVYLFITNQPENIERYGTIWNGIRIGYCSQSAIGSPYEHISKASILSSIQLDYIHCMSPGARNYLPGWIAKKKQNNKPTLIVDFDEWLSLWYSYPKRFYVQLWDRFARQTADRIIFASDYLLKQRTTKYINTQKYFYLPYAVDWDQFRIDSVGWECIRQQYKGRHLAIYMGALLPQYNAKKILEIVSLVSSENPKVLFLFIGSGSLQKELEQQVEEQKLTHWVQFLGYLPDKEMKQHLCAANVLLFPIEDTILNRSRCPSKIFQYLAAQRPIVTNRVVEVFNILGEHALYFNFNSPEDFAQKILFALQQGIPIPPDSLLEQHTWGTRYMDYLAILNNTHTKSFTY